MSWPSTGRARRHWSTVRLSARQARPLHQFLGHPPPAASLDIATGDTILDLGATSLWGGVFGPPREDGRPGIVVVLAGDANDAHVRDLSTGADLGTYAPDNGFVLKAALTADGQAIGPDDHDGDLIVLDLAKLAHAHRPKMQ